MVYARSFLFVIVFIFLFSCENDNPVTPGNFPPELSRLVVPDTVFTGINESYIFSVQCSDENGLDDIDSVNFQIVTLTDRLVLSGIMYDDGNHADHGDNVPLDGKYAFRLNDDLTEGGYRFVVQASDLSGAISGTLSDTFYAMPGIFNQAPAITAYHLPDSVIVDEIVPFFISVSASDPDSLDSITKVTYQILGPTATETAEQGELYDNGSDGDSLAGDGIFSFRTTTEFANWKFGSYHLIIVAFDTHQQQSNTIYEILPWAKMNLGVAPQIVSVTAPDTIKLPASTAKSYFLTVRATDDDDNRDVREVTFNTFKPDGTPSSGNPFKMYDDGTSGDAIPGDNNYSLVIWISSQNAVGNYRFEFQAKDYSDLLSDRVIHTITVIQ